MTIPLLVLLAFRRLDARKVWILWPLTIAPDLDYFLGFHRATTTNVFVLLPFVALLAASLHPRWKSPARAEWMLVALVYLGSHFVMDMFTGGIVFFYPISDYTYCYYFEILVRTADNTPFLDYGACSREGIPTVVEVYPWLSWIDAAMLAFLLPTSLVALALKLRERRRSSPRDPRAP